MSHSPLPLNQKLRKDRVVTSPPQKAQNPGAVLSVFVLVRPEMGWVMPCVLDDAVHASESISSLVY